MSFSLKTKMSSLRLTGMRAQGAPIKLRLTKFLFCSNVLCARFIILSIKREKPLRLPKVIEMKMKTSPRRKDIWVSLGREDRVRIPGRVQR
jgi:hypothetical protein